MAGPAFVAGQVLVYPGTPRQSSIQSALEERETRYRRLREDPITPREESFQYLHSYMDTHTLAITRRTRKHVPIPNALDGDHLDGYDRT